MAYLAYIPLSFFLLILQTVFLPEMLHAENAYNLTLLLVLFLGFHRSVTESVPVIIFLGFLSDCFSGGPFGLYTTTYIWLFVGVKTVVQYLHVDSLPVLLSGILAAVMIEHATVWVSLAMRQAQWHLAVTSVKTAVLQIVWALLTGPLVFYMIKKFFQSWEMWVKKHFGSSMDPDDL